MERTARARVVITQPVGSGWEQTEYAIVREARNNAWWMIKVCASSSAKTDDEGKPVVEEFGKVKGIPTRAVDGHVYRLERLNESQMACTCRGYKSHGHCKHASWLAGFVGPKGSSASVADVAKMSDELHRATEYAEQAEERAAKLAKRIAELEEALYLEREHVGRLMDQLASEETYASESFAQNDVVHWHKRGYEFPVRCEVVEVTEQRVRVKTPDGKRRWFPINASNLTKAV